MPVRVLLVGQEAAGAQILRAVSHSTNELVAVLTDEPSTKGGPASLARAAELSGVDVLPASHVRDPDFAAQVRDWKIDVILNVHSLHVINGEVLLAPSIGSFNLHPGPLPEYAGLNTVGWAIYNGEAEYGVTVHWMVPDIDAGPIAYQERFALPERSTALTLSAECTRRGVRLLERTLDDAGRDPPAIPREEQDLSRRRYYARRCIPQDGRVDWTASSSEVARLVRAFDYGPFASPWGRPVADLGGTRVELSSVETGGPTGGVQPGTVRDSGAGSIEVACADAWVRISGSRQLDPPGAMA